MTDTHAPRTDGPQPADAQPADARLVDAQPADGQPADTRLVDFEQHRRLVFGIAYRMLGSVADAEDLVQDTWLRWSRVTGPVASPAGFLARTVTNLALNRLDSAAVRREAYVGPWLPEPLVTEPDATDGVERAETVSLALLVLLENLSPLERAVFVLKEAFAFSYLEIAEALDRTEVACRQIGSRARAHVRARRPRYDAPPELRRRATDEFLAACVGGDLNRMLELLAPDVTTWSDGGGVIRAALRPVTGAENVARFTLGVLRQLGEGAAVHPVLVNGEAGLLVTVDGAVDSVSVFDFVEGPDGTPLISAIRAVRNPHKLGHLAGLAPAADAAPDPTPGAAPGTDRA
ncbi:RNA polymerase sigma24 factor [Kitasatospora xanthocidica]|uniref:RNA polymerase sigma-70 factor n=1 Tax=Kitasatospora xanthocidica TaxID=83382 RepID=UPI0019CD19F2|nr:RNA polymerase sigma-70 factor [Kitasatospora xanthocidica]GHF46532.1 RNA polymerase sigma24 factor [Kitasatospora xanthocidica]